MNVNLELKVDLGDEFIECEGGSERCTSISLADALSNSIKYTLKNEILRLISEPMIKAIREEVKDYVISRIRVFVEATMEQELSTLKITEYGTAINAKEYIAKTLESKLTSNDTSRMIRAIAENYVVTIKDRYDVVFASTLIDKMLKANLLKDETVAKLLIEQDK